MLLRALSSQVVETPEGADSAISQHKSLWLVIFTVKVFFFFFLSRGKLTCFNYEVKTLSSCSW